MREFKKRIHKKNSEEEFMREFKKKRVQKRNSEKQFIREFKKRIRKGNS